MRHRLRNVGAGALLIVAAQASAQDKAMDVSMADRGPRFFMTSATSMVRLDISRTPVLHRRVSLNLESVALRTVLDAIARQAGLSLSFSPDVVDVAMPVSFVAQNLTVAAALTEVLLEVPVDVVLSPNGQLSLVRRPPRPAVGNVTGKVIDSTTREALGGVSVWVEGTRLATTSGSDGGYTIRNVPAGERTVATRRLGYKKLSVAVTVADGETVTANFVLVRSPAMLEEVVSTASGRQRRIEVGHVINHVNADSIAPTAPITSLTDMLSGRAPGVQVYQTNGLVGSSVGIRIRGQSSLTLNSDPIVIVDGVRQDNNPGGGYSGWYGGYATPSRLNDLDFSQIESVDVLNGPAASTQYGTDAANGVIVITTKRGRVGKPQWHASAERGWSEVPRDFADMWFSHGTWTAAGTAARGRSGYVACPIVSLTNSAADQVKGWCMVDSVTRDNPLNHKHTTVFRSGLRERLTLDVSGGTDAVQYYVAGSASNEVGTVQLPQVFESQARNLGFPDDIMEPNTSEQRSVRSNVTARLSPAFQVSLNGAYMTNSQRSPAAAGGGLMPGRTQEPAILDSAHHYGYGAASIPGETPLNSLGSWTTDANKRATAGLRAEWQPRSWFTAYTTVGIDHSSQRLQFLWHPIAYWISRGQRDRGWLSITNGTTDILSFDSRGSVTKQLTRALRSVTSVGYQVARTQSQSTFAGVQEVSESNISLNGVPNPQVRESGNGSATSGGYLEQHFNLAERLFLSAAVRVDGASGFGDDYHLTAYPKVNASWLALHTGDYTVRLRGAYGAAGKQPDNGTALQTYFPRVVFAEGIDRTASAMTSSGNPDLRPERSQEFEAGVDVSGFNDRLSVALSRYTKRTTDALTGVNLGVTLGNLSTQENLGDVKNWGYEATVQAAILQTEQLTWDLTVNASRNRNRLLRIARGVLSQQDHFMFTHQHRVGYPLYGYWARRATYQDTDGDGIIVPTEITLEDTVSYMGSSLPTVETGIASNVGLFRGRLTLSALLDHRVGGVVLNREIISQGQFTRRAMHDSTAPLWMQARERACHSCTTSLNFEEGWFVRFRELSATVTVPQRWLRLSRARNLSVTTAVRNLGLWTHYSGADPESTEPGARRAATGVSSSIDSRRTGGNSVPMPRTWMIRVNAGL